MKCSYIFSSACKLEEDEVTVMKYTNETLKPQPSEDFTNINESEPYAYPTNLSSQYEKFEQENSARNREETKDENYNLQSENSASTKIVKIS